MWDMHDWAYLEIVQSIPDRTWLRLIAGSIQSVVPTRLDIVRASGLAAACQGHQKVIGQLPHPLDSSIFLFAIWCLAPIPWQKEDHDEKGEEKEDEEEEWKEAEQQPDYYKLTL